MIVVIAAASDVDVPQANTLADGSTVAHIVDVLQRGEHADYVVDYEFTRVRPDDGQRLTNTVTEARYRGASLTRSGGTLTVQLPAVRYTCESVGARRATCFETHDRASLPLSELVKTAVDTGAYAVRGAPKSTVAGEPADCYVVTSRVAGNELAGLGRETTLCVGADGIPLSTSIASLLATDRWDAVRVQRNIDRADLTPVLAGFDPAAARIPK